MLESLFRQVAIPWLVLATLHVLRAGAFVMALGLMGAQGESRILRLVLSVSIGLLVFAVVRDSAGALHVVEDNLADGILGLAVMVAQEIIVGLALGFSLSLVMLVLVSAGEIMSVEMGFAMARSLNPVTGTNSTVMSQLFQTFGYLIFFSTDLHHDVLRLFHELGQVLPVGVPPDIGLIWMGLRELTAGAIDWGMRFAFPIMAVMMLLTTTMVLLSRAVPNINLMEFAFGVRILLALTAASWFLMDSLDDFPNLFGYFMEGAAGMFRPA